MPARPAHRHISGDPLDYGHPDLYASSPPQRVLQDVTFDAIGRHEVNCKAGVVKTVGAAAAETAAPSAAPLGWEGAEWVATPRA